MMNNKIVTTVIALMLVAATCCACTLAAPAVNTPAAAAAKNSSVAVDPAASDALQLTHSVLELPLTDALGRIYPIHAAQTADLQWRVEDSTVAEVSGGIITPVAAGTTVISCTDGTNTATCKVIVTNDTHRACTLRVPAPTMSVTVGDAGQVDYTYDGFGAVTVFSDNPQVLQVENGQYVAQSAGTAVITCTDGIHISQCKVTVTESGPMA